MTIREDVLEQAKKCVLGDRLEDYGNPENNFNVIAQYWSVYLSTTSVPGSSPRELTGRDVALMMILLKVARSTYGSKLDNWVDMAGYAACGAELEKQMFKNINID